VTLPTSYEKPSDVKSPLTLFEFFLFFSRVAPFPDRPILSPSPASALYRSSLLFFMPKKKKTVGPWELNEVKTRLRREQVAREAAATARYRQAEERETDQGSSHCVLVIAVLSCLLLSLSVLVLAGVVLSLAKK
jgi:hypothetical protein